MSFQKSELLRLNDSKRPVSEMITLDSESFTLSSICFDRRSCLIIWFPRAVSSRGSPEPAAPRCRGRINRRATDTCRRNPPGSGGSRSAARSASATSRADFARLPGWDWRSGAECRKRRSPRSRSRHRSAGSAGGTPSYARSVRAACLRKAADLFSRRPAVSIAASPSAACTRRRTARSPGSAGSACPCAAARRSFGRPNAASPAGPGPIYGSDPCRVRSPYPGARSSGAGGASPAFPAEGAAAGYGA
eukprot:284819603_4